MQQVTTEIGDAFVQVEEALQETFLPSLFQVLVEGVPGIGVTRLLVKQAGLALPEPTKTATENWTAPFVITGHVIAVLRGQEEFRTADRWACL